MFIYTARICAVRAGQLNLCVQGHNIDVSHAEQHGRSGISVAPRCLQRPCGNLP